MWEDICQFYANTRPFSAGNLSIHEFWYLISVCNESSSHKPKDCVPITFLSSWYNYLWDHFIILTVFLGAFHIPMSFGNSSESSWFSASPVAILESSCLGCISWGLFRSWHKDRTKYARDLWEKPPLWCWSRLGLLLEHDADLATWKERGRLDKKSVRHYIVPRTMARQMGWSQTKTTYEKSHMSPENGPVLVSLFCSARGWEDVVMKSETAPGVGAPDQPLWSWRSDERHILRGTHSPSKCVNSHSVMAQRDF